MKRLLLATLILGLLIPDSAFANRSKLKQQENALNKEKLGRKVNEKEKKKIEKFISLCNNSDKPENSRDYVYCYKVTGEYRKKITKKSFIEAAKELSRERLDICIRPEKYGYADRLRQEQVCRDFLNEPHTYWLRNEVTKEEYDLVEKYVSQFDLKRTEEIERLKERFKNTNIKPYLNNGSKLDIFFYCQKQQENIGATREEMNKECGRIPL